MWVGEGELEIFLGHDSGNHGVVGLVGRSRSTVHLDFGS